MYLILGAKAPSTLSNAFSFGSVFETLRYVFTHPSTLSFSQRFPRPHKTIENASLESATIVICACDKLRQRFRKPLFSLSTLMRFRSAPFSPSWCVFVRLRFRMTSVFKSLRFHRPGAFSFGSGSVFKCLHPGQCFRMYGQF